ncbi:hypothetical protein MRX96_052719 [Rhipicephalus microplus]
MAGGGGSSKGVGEQTPESLCLPLSRSDEQSCKGTSGTDVRLQLNWHVSRTLASWQAEVLRDRGGPPSGWPTHGRPRLRPQPGVRREDSGLSRKVERRRRNPIKRNSGGGANQGDYSLVDFVRTQVLPWRPRFTAPVPRD